MSLKGGQATAGSRILAGYRAPYDAHITERLHDAGAVILGKTNMDEFAMGSSTEHSAFGPTSNPWDLDRVPGGSSGGSAAAVAAFHAPLSIGTDTGGSIRQPASLTGIVGLKPTYGRVSRYGIVAFASSLDQIGPFARDARDAAALLHAVAGRDERDSTSSPVPVPDDLLHLPASDDEAAATLRGKRLGLPREYFVAGMEPGVEARIREAVAALEAAGATSRTSACPTPSTAWPRTTSSPRPRRRRTWPATTASATGRGWATARTSWRATWRPAARASGPRSSAASCSARTPFRRATTTPTTSRRRRCGRSSRATSTPSGRRASTRSSRRPRPTVAFRFGARMADPVSMYLSDACTLPVNMAGLPGISIPAGLSEGLPVGLQFIGAPWSEPALLGLARGYEAITADADWRALEPAGLAALDDPATRADAAVTETADRPPLAERALAQRVPEVPPSGIRRFFDIAATMDDVISLGVGEPDFATPRADLEAGVESLREGRTDYTSNYGTLELRQALADHLERLYGVRYDPATRAPRSRSACRRRSTSPCARPRPRRRGHPARAVVRRVRARRSSSPAASSVHVADPLRGRLRARSGGRRGGHHAAHQGALPRLPEQPHRRGPARRRSRTRSPRIAERHDLLVISDEIYDRLVYGGDRHRASARCPACASARSCSAASPRRTP